MSDSPGNLKHSLARARWSVIQTGLITSGLALFGVYVLANRINDVQVMNLYIFTWIPAGAWLVGTVAGSGYAIASWWNGMRVRGTLMATVLLLQLMAYFCAHYVQFESFDFVYRETNEPVSFLTYFHYVTMNMTRRDDDEGGRLAGWGYAVRIEEALVFCIGAATSAVVLSGQPRCPVCGGAMRRRRIAALVPTTPPESLRKLEDLALIGNVAGFKTLLGTLEHLDAQTITPGRVEVWLFCCAVCGSGSIAYMVRPGAESKKPPPPGKDVPATFVLAYFTPDGRPVGELRGFTSRPSAPP